MLHTHRQRESRLGAPFVKSHYARDWQSNGYRVGRSRFRPAMARVAWAWLELVAHQLYRRSNMCANPSALVNVALIRIARALTCGLAIWCKPPRCARF
jgi:hypothetical protein